MSKASREHIDFAIAALFRPGDVVELRIPKGRQAPSDLRLLRRLRRRPRSTAAVSRAEARRIASSSLGKQKKPTAAMK